MMLKVKFWTSEKLLSLSALLVSLCTLIVFAYQTNLVRKQQYATVYPHLIVGNVGSGKLDYRYILQNKGVGPAVLKHIHIQTGGGQLYADFEDYVYNSVTKEDSIYYYSATLYPGRLLQPDEIIPVIELSDNEELKSSGRPLNTYKSSAKLYEVLNTDSLTVEITYESIYGESWTVTNYTYAPIKN